MKILLLFLNVFWFKLIIDKKRFKDIKWKLDLSLATTNMILEMAPNRLPLTEPIVINSKE